MLAFVFLACDPRGCGCGCGCGCGSPPTTTVSMDAGPAPSCTFGGGCTPLYTTFDAGVRRPDAWLAPPLDAAVPIDVGCITSAFGAPCVLSCPLGYCSTETSIRTQLPDGGITPRTPLPETICAWTPTTGSCPCNTTLATPTLGTANESYARTSGICMRSCTFDSASPGACPVAMTCDPTGVCQEACTSDDVCQLRARDVDGDSVVEWVVDPSTGGRCDATTGRCTRPGQPSASVGDACSDDHDCMPDGMCWPAPVLGEGQCVRIGCAACDGACVTLGGRTALCVPCALGTTLGASCLDAGSIDASIDAEEIDAADAGLDGG